MTFAVILQCYQIAAKKYYYASVILTPVSSLIPLDDEEEPCGVEKIREKLFQVPGHFLTTSKKRVPVLLPVCRWHYLTLKEFDHSHVQVKWFSLRL